jgi:hypothetical protein
VRTALASGDVGRARVIVDALRERGVADASSLGDTVAIAEASKLSGDARLSLLDSVAAHSGSAATEAATIAKGPRMDNVIRHGAIGLG